MDPSSGKSTCSRFAICSGLHEGRPAAVLTAPMPTPDPADRRASHSRAVRGRDLPASRSCTYAAAHRWLRAWPPSGAWHADRRATGRSWPDTPDHRHGSPHCGAAPARSSMGTGPAAERSRAPRSPGHAGQRSLPARRRTKSGPTAEPRLDRWHPTTFTEPAVPTAGDTPARHAASSLDGPPAIANQNRCRCSRVPPVVDQVTALEHAAPDQPVDAHWLPSQLLTVEMLRRLLESAQYTSFAYGRRLAASELVASMGTVGDASTTPSPRASSPPWSAGSSTAIPGRPERAYGRRTSTSSRSSTTANAATRPLTTIHPPSTSTTTHQQHPRPNHRVHGNGATPTSPRKPRGEPCC